MFNLYAMLKDLWINDRFKFHVAWLNAVSLSAALFMAFNFSAVLAASSVSVIVLCSFLNLYVFYLLSRSSVRYLQLISHLEKKNDALLEKVAEDLLKNKP